MSRKRGNRGGQRHRKQLSPQSFGRVDQAPMRHSRMDVFSNSITGLESHNSKTACNSWSFQVGQPRSILENFYQFSPIGARIVDKEPADALRRGYSVESEEIGESEQKDIADWNRRRQFLGKFAQARKWERLFGGSLLFMGIDDGREVDEPVDVQNIRNFGQLTVLSRYDVNVSEYRNDPLTGDLARPSFYNLNQTGLKIHPSRTIEFNGIQLTIDQMMNNGGFGGSAIDRAWGDLERYITTNTYLAEAVTRMTQGVFQSPSLTTASSADCGQANILEDRLTALGQWIGMLGDIVIGEDESYQVIQRGLQGFRDAAEVFVDALTAATDIPKSILFGITVGGLNSGENAGDWQSWTSHLSGVQVEIYDPRVSEYQTLVFAADNSPLAFVPERWTIGWPKLFQNSELDQSTVLANTANAASILLTQRVITEEQAQANEAIQEAFPAQEDVQDDDELAFGEDPQAQELQEEQAEGVGPDAQLSGLGVESLQQTALNGAQITALLSIVEEVKNGSLSEEAGVIAVSLGFPQILESEVRRLMRAAKGGKPKLEIVKGE